MKFIIVLSLAALALATEFHMEFEEGGQKFVEKIKVDVAGNTERISVPQHVNRGAVDVLKDFTAGLTAQKFIKEKICYISELKSGDELPVQMKRSMLISGAKFPKSRYEVIRNSLFPLRKMTAGEVGAKIAAHCQGYKLIKVVVVDESNINEVVTKIVRRKQAKAARSKRDVVVQTFGACTLASTNVINGCRAPKKLAAKCQFLRSDAARCVYSVSCPVGPTGFNCAGRHVFSSPTCCDFTCA